MNPTQHPNDTKRPSSANNEPDRTFSVSQLSNLDPSQQFTHDDVQGRNVQSQDVFPDYERPSKPIFCDYCEVKFTGYYQKGNLKRHLTSKHPGELAKPSSVQCSVCSMRFNRADKRKNHEWQAHHLEISRPRRMDGSKTPMKDELSFLVPSSEGIDAIDNSVNRRGPVKPQNSNIASNSTYHTSINLAASRIPSLSEESEPRVRATLNNINVLAVPDTCSTLNIISRAFLRRHAFVLDNNTAHSMRLPDGTFITSLGNITLQMQFEGERMIYKLPFTVLNNCVHDVVLGNFFLRATQTITKFKHRIKWHPKERGYQLPRVRLVDTPQQGVHGSINGYFVSASPDTGSDVNLIRKDLAKKLGFRIDQSPGRVITLEFINGMSVRTYGVISGMEWRFDETEDSAEQVSQQRSSLLLAAKPMLIQDWIFGADASPQETFICDFYVLEKLTSPIILSSNLLLGSNAFASCAGNFSDMDRFGQGSTEDADACFIRKQKTGTGKHRSLRDVIFRRPTGGNSKCQSIEGPSVTETYQADNATPTPIDPLTNAWATEIVRRGAEAERIHVLPADEQAAAQEAESHRVQQWNDGHNSQSSTQQPSSGSQAASGNTDTNGGS